MKELNCFLCIIRRKETDEFVRFFEKNGVRTVLTANCEGTAQSKTLDLLGVEEVEKTLLLCVLRQEKLRTVIRHLSTDMQIDLPGRGVGLALPIDGVGGESTLELLSGGAPLKEREETLMETKYRLLVAIAEKGNADTVMDVARNAGAGGGTVVRTKGTRPKRTAGFFKVSIADEKETILIVADAASADGIMQAIMDNAGAHTAAKAIVFSLPVTATAGFRLIEEARENAAEEEELAVK